MRIVHISTNDVSGGAARAAYRLHKGLQRLGHESLMYVANQSSADPQVISIGADRSIGARLRRRIRREMLNRDFKPYWRTRPSGLESFSDDRSVYGREIVRRLPPSDIINLHYVASFLDFGAFFPQVTRRTPVVWRLPDMFAFTGGCHYDECCGRFSGSCGACPQLGSNDPKDLSRRVWERKRAAFAAIPPGRLHIVALNNWIAGEVRRSSLLHNVPITIIPNGLDTEAFAPRDKAFARAVLGVPQDARVVLFVAASVGNRRKGFDLLAAALAGMRAIPNLFLIAIGRGDSNLGLDIPHLALGALSQDRLLSLVYSAADLYVIPSRQDNLPNTVLEAMACGTPTVGFDVGGVGELVRPGVTGLLAHSGDVADLRAKMIDLLANPELQASLGEQCRQTALAEYRQELQAQRYADLYTSMLA